MPQNLDHHKHHKILPGQIISIIKITLEKNHHEHHGKGILTNHHDLISSRSLPSSHPRSTSRRKATSLWSFRLSLYHWFFIVDFVITLSLISCYPFIIDFSHLIIDFIRKWQFQPRTVMIVLNRKSSSWPAWKVCHHRIFCNGGYISSNCCVTNIAIRFCNGILTIRFECAINLMIPCTANWSEINWNVRFMSTPPRYFLQW